MSEISESETVANTIGSEGVTMGDVVPATEDEQAKADLFALSLTGRKKKKQRKEMRPVDDKPVVAEAVVTLAPDAAPNVELVSDEEWRPYEYIEMLEMIYDRMRKRGSGGFARGGDGMKRFVVPLPQVIKLGTKKSGFVNFGEISESLGREQSHIQRFLDVELGTTSRLDGAGTLVLKGKHGRGDVESVLKRYIKDYVRCRTCRGHSTRFERDRSTRLDFLVCNDCSARSSVTAVEGGFTALTEKRSKLRRQEDK